MGFSNLKNKLKKIIRLDNGFSLIELMIVISLMAAASLVSVKVMENQTKGQKTISIKSEMQNLQFRIRSMLRTSEGCENTLAANSVMSTEPKYVVKNASISECIKSGKLLQEGIVRGERRITLSDSFGAGSGLKVRLGEARVIFNGELSESDKDVYGTICYQLVTEGLKEGGAFGATYLSESPDIRVNQIYQWFEEDILVKNIDGLNANTITHCNSDISSFSSANCESFGGYFDNETQECKSINIKVGEAKEDEPPFVNNIVTDNSAITSLGNLSSTGHGVFCGSVHIGNNDTISDLNTNCEKSLDENVTQEQAGSLYVAKNIIANEEIMSDTGRFPSLLQVGLAGSGKALVEGILEVTDSLTAVKGSVRTENLSVNGSAEVSTFLSVGKSLKVQGEGDIDGVIINQNAISSRNGLNFYSNSNGDHTFFSKLKAIGDDTQFDTGAPDYLATMTYVNRLMLSKMTDEDRQKLFNELLNAAESTGIDILKDNFLSSITQVNGNNSTSGVCNNGYVASKINTSYDSSSNLIEISLDCELPTPRVGTPINCTKRVVVTGGRDGNYGNALGGYPIAGSVTPCLDRSHVVISGSCSNVDYSKKDVGIRIASSVHLNDNVNSNGIVCSTADRCEPPTTTHFTDCTGNNCNAFLCLVDGNSSVENIRTEITCCEVFSADPFVTPSNTTTISSPPSN